MFLIRLLPVTRNDRLSGHGQKCRTSWGVKLWRMAMDWLLEPIRFPGKTYDLDPDWADGKRNSFDSRTHNQLSTFSVKKQ
jgi:hypothetical protein